MKAIICVLLLTAAVYGADEKKQEKRGLLGLGYGGGYYGGGHGLGLYGGHGIGLAAAPIVSHSVAIPAPIISHSIGAPILDHGLIGGHGLYGGHDLIGGHGLIGAPLLGLGHGGWH